MGIAAYDPPGFMSDFDRIPGARAAWSRAVSGWIDEAIGLEEPFLLGQPCQYFNQLTNPPTGLVLEQDIVWNGFSGTLRNRYGRAWALEIAEHLLPLTQRIDRVGGYMAGGQWEQMYYRPHDEYCEFRCERTRDGRIRKVTFTSEPPEYWQALHGDTLPSIMGAPTYAMPGDPDLVLELYREYVGPDVQYEDLICHEDLVDHTDPSNPLVVYPKGSYNPYNRWNTTDGIMHLNQPNNSLGAEIKLAADATVLRSRTAPSGPLVTDPDALIMCAAYGGPNRCSDPTIGASVYELAAMGAAVTLRNPIGLYMDHLDMTGFARPDGSPVDPSWFRVLRGAPGLIERAVFEVPEREGFVVGDLTIGGVPITLGAQLAEHITVKLVGLATDVGKYANAPSPCQSGACLDEANPSYVYYQPLGAPCPPGREPAFDYGEPAAPALAAAAATATAPVAHARRSVSVPAHRRR